MIDHICAIRDSKAEAWMQPLFFRSKAQAIRSWADAVNDKSTEFAKHPEDYAMFALGTFDPEYGTIVVYPQPELLGLGANYLRLEQ